MTERRKQTAMDDDDISITSSVVTAHDSDEDFYVESILSEKIEQGVKKYLIFWTGYPIERATWEPTESIGEDLLEAWESKKRREERGLETPFNVAAWEANDARLAKEKEDRKKRRKAKRKRIGLQKGQNSQIEAVNDANEEELGDNLAPSRSVVTAQDKVTTATPAKSITKTVHKKTKFDRKPSDSSSDIPLSKRNSVGELKSTKDGVPSNKQPGSRTVATARNSSSSEEQLRKKRAVPEGSSASRKPTMMSEPEIEPAAVGRGRPSLRGSSASRGKIATRGGSNIAHKNVFESREPPKKRGNLLTHAMDTNKAPKSFTNIRLHRRAELQARDLAESAPDIDALGGLFDPSKPITLKPIRPADVRKLPSSATTSAEDDQNHDGDIDDILDAPKNFPHMPPSKTVQYRGPPVCFYWDRENKSRGGACRNGYTCSFLHEYRAGAPISDPPPGYIDGWMTRGSTAKPSSTNQEHTSEPSLFIEDAPDLIERPPSPFRSPPHTLDTTKEESQTQRAQFDPAFPYNSICFFWHFNSQCSWGDKCKYNHINDARMAFAPPPPGWGGKGDERREGGQEVQSPNIQRLERVERLEQSELQVRPQWNPSEPQNAICYFWHTTGRCSRENSCKYYHNDDVRLPIAPSPSEQARFQRYMPCKFWKAGVTCHDGDHCRYSHGEAPDAAVYSALTGSNQVTPLPPLNGAYDSSRAAQNSPTVLSPTGNSYANSPMPILGASNQTYQAINERERSSLPRQSPIQRLPPALKCGGSIVSGGPPVKSVRFDDSIPPDKDAKDSLQSRPSHTYQPGQSPRELLPKATLEQQQRDNRPICNFYLQGRCEYGRHCRNRHSREDESVQGDQMDFEMENQDTRRDSAFATRSGSTGTIREEDTPMETGVPPVPENAILEKPPSSITPLTPKRKISLKAYQSKKSPKLNNGRTKLVTFGSQETQSQALDFVNLRETPSSPWNQQFASISNIKFDKICIVQDLEIYNNLLQPQLLDSGSLMPAESDPDSLIAVGRIKDEMILRSIVLVSTFDDFSILLYPTGRDEYKFLEAASDFEKDVQIRYIIFQCAIDIRQCGKSTSKILSIGSPYLKQMTNEIHGLNIQSMLPHVKDRDPKNFFLLFPATAKDTADFLTIWLRRSLPECKIYSISIGGSWDYFVNSGVVKAGSILIHESVVTGIHQLPFLFNLIQGGHFTFWHIADSGSPYPLYPSRSSSVSPRIGRITSTRLFPSGLAFLLTPSLLVGEPQRALEVVTWFLKGKDSKFHHGSRHGRGTYRLVCCHGYLDYLLDLAKEKALDREAFMAKFNDSASDAMAEVKGISRQQCEARFKLHAFLVSLDMQGLLDSNSDGDDIYTIGDEVGRPIAQAPSYIDPDDEKGLVDWFAGWTMRNLDNYRRFVVLGTSESSQHKVHRVKEVVVRKASVVESPSHDQLKLNSFAFGGKKSVSKPEADLLSPRTTDMANDGRQRALAIAAKLGESDPKISSKDVEQNPFDDVVNPSTLDFIGRTGASPVIAETSLAKSNKDVQRAAQLYTSEFQNSMSVDAQITNLIASATPTPDQFLPHKSPLRIGTTTSDLSRSRDMYQSPNSAYPTSARSPQGFPQFDGADDARSPQYSSADERPTSSGSDSSRASRAGIVTGPDGKRYIPSSLRSDNSVRREISIKPGYVPREDISYERYTIPQRDPSKGGSLSSRASPAPPNPNDTPKGLSMTEDRERALKQIKWADIDLSDPSSVEPEDQVVETEKKEIKFEPTKRWYDNLKKEGGGWEHINVACGDEAIKKALQMNDSRKKV